MASQLHNPDPKPQENKNQEHKDDIQERKAVIAKWMKDCYFSLPESERIPLTDLQTQPLTSWLKHLQDAVERNGIACVAYDCTLIEQCDGCTAADLMRELAGIDNDDPGMKRTANEVNEQCCI